MSYSSTRAAATSSCVESGFEAQSTTSAPPACRVRTRFAVSVVTCRQAGARGQAGGDAAPGGRLLALEALPDRGEDRHLPVGPLDPAHALRGEPEILHVVSLCRCHSFLSPSSA